MNHHVVAQDSRTMSTEEIAELCGARHNDVANTVARLYEQGVLRDRRKTPRVVTTGQGGRPKEVFDLTYRDCMVVVSGYKPEVRARIIDRWLELEKTATPQLPQTFAQALRLAAEQAEVIEQQSAQLALAAPKVEFVERFVESSSGSKGFREVCKLLGAKEPQFRAFLYDCEIMYRLGDSWTAYQKHIDAGRFEVKAGTVNDHAYTQSKFTAKGVEWIAGEWAKYKVRGAA